MIKKILLIFLVIIVLIIVLFINGKIWFVSPDRNLFPVRGIDVSHYQGNIDWRKVSGDDVKFVFIKATEADDLKDDRFLYNWENARDNKLLTGAYHFYSLAYPGKLQAQNFINTVPIEANQLPPVIDLEYKGNSAQRPDKNTLQDDLKDYVEEITVHYGKKPILYTTYKFYSDYLYPEFQGYEIWIRDVLSEPDNQKVNNWIIWQYNPFGKIDGIKGYVDLNITSQKFLLHP